MENKKSLFRVNYLFIAAALFCVLVLMLSTVSCKSSGNDNEESQKDISNEENTVPDIDDDRIIWHGLVVYSNDKTPLSQWNGLSVSEALITALEGAESSEWLAISIRFKDAQFLEDLTYEGKKYTELREEYYSYYNHLSKLEVLKNDGHLLKYGELIYTEGVHNQKWTQEEYEDLIEFYGEELLNEYIVDGVFLEDKISKDLKDTQNKTDSTKEILDFLEFDEYRISIPKKIVENFEPYEYNVIYYSNHFGRDAVLLITKEDFLKIKIDNPEQYAFRHAVYYDRDIPYPLPE